MAEKLAGVIQKWEQARPLLVRGFKGLSLLTHLTLRGADTWQQLDNLDLVIDGQIRKVLPASLISGPFPNILYQLLEYRRRINYQGGALRVVAIDSIGKLWDINGSTITPLIDISASFSGGITDVPYLGQMQGYYVPFVIKTWLTATAYSQYDGVFRYSVTDGNLYCYYASIAGTSGTNEPVWPATQGSTVGDGGITWTNAGILNQQRFKLNWGIIVSKSFAAIKFVEYLYDPTSGTEAAKWYSSRIGISQPLASINVVAGTTIGSLAGYAPAAGRFYTWTYYNPNTLHDSSPAPATGPLKVLGLDASPVGLQQLNGSLTPVLTTPGGSAKAFRSYQSVYLEIPTAALTPTFGDGYTHIRVWGTKDGGSNFFLVTQLYDNNGNLISNGDGSVPVSRLTALQSSNGWTDYAAIPTPQNKVAVARVYDGGSTVSNLVPDPIYFSAWNGWSPTKLTIIVIPNDSPLGQSALAIIGTGTSTTQFYNSPTISLAANTGYVFKGYIDNTAGSGGTVAWAVTTPDFGTYIASAAQTAGTAGYVTLTFNSGSHTSVRVQAYFSGVTISSNSQISMSEPVLQQGSSITTPTYMTPDSSLVYPAPAPLSQNPPPANCLTGVIFNNALFLVDYNDPTRVWFSNNGDFNSFGVNSYLQSPSSRSLTIMELVPGYDRLLVTSPRFMEQIVVTPGGYLRLPLDPQHGSLSHKGSIPYGSMAFMLTEAGIASMQIAASTTPRPAGSVLQIGYTPEAIISRPIKTLLDAIQAATIHLDNNVVGAPLPAIDNLQDLYLLGYRANAGSAALDTIVAMPLRGEAVGQFSRLTTLPGDGQISSMKEVQLSAAGAYAVVALGHDKKVYKMFGGTQDGTLTATAVTQPLPTLNDIEPELWDTDKAFQELILEGADLTNWTVSAGVDGGTTFPYGNWTLVAGQNLINLGGIEARQLTLKFVHSVAGTGTPALTSFKLSYTILGKRP